MREIRKRLTYANVMSSIAMFLVVAGGAAFAATQLPKNSVGAKQLKKGAVKTSKLSAKAVKAGKLAPGAVKTGRIRDEAVTGDKIAAGSVSTDTIAPQAVTGDKIADSAVTGPQLADDSVTQAKIAAGSVGTAQLKDITTVSETSASVGNGVSTGVTANCPSGEVAISGGFETGNVGAATWELKRLVRFGNGWRAFGRNISGGDSTITAFAYCLGG